MSLGRFFSSRLAIPALLLAALVLSACGSSKKSTSASSSTSSSQSGVLALSISDATGGAQFTVSKSVQGGVVTVTLKNQGRAPHSAQLVLLKGNHTTADVLKQFAGNSRKTPSWLRAEGGVGLVLPGQSSSATVLLPAGHYVVTEEPGGPGGGRPAVGDFQVTPGASGSLPTSATTVTAATAGKDKYKWQLSGRLHTGANRVKFVSKGSDAIHVLVAVPITGHPSKATILKGLQANTPPPFFKFQGLGETAALDGGKSTVTDLNLAAPGRYVLFCPISDRDGGKPHFAEGLLTTVTVQ